MKAMGILSWSGLILSALAGLFLGVSAYTFHYANGASYLADDPAACSNCHIMRDHFDGWAKASHHAVATCNDCHVPHDLVGKWVTKSLNGYHHSRAFTFGDFHEPIRIKPVNAAVLEANCLHCHGEFVDSITAHGGLGRAVGTVPGDLFGCVRCHANVGHGPRR